MSENEPIYFVKRHGLLFKVFETVKNSAYPHYEDHEFDYKLDSTWEDINKANEHCRILNQQINDGN